MDKDAPVLPMPSDLDAMKDSTDSDCDGGPARVHRPSDLQGQTHDIQGKPSGGCRGPGCRKRLGAMKSSSDWNSVWIGVFHLACIVVAVQLGSDDTVIPEFTSWSGNPLNAMSNRTAVFQVAAWSFNGSVYLRACLSLLGCLVAMGGPLALSCYFMGESVKAVLPPFCVLFLIACLSRWTGSNAALSPIGLGSTVWALLYGLFIVNVLGCCMPKFILWLKPSSKQGEFYIKVGLVLMAVRLQKLAEFGIPGLMVSWGVTPLVIIFMWTLGRSRFMPANVDPAMIMCLACGTSVCGTSAIAAVSSAIDAPKDDVVLSISIVSFMTIFFMFALPYIAIWTGLNHVIAGAWIGGSINNTGNVVASARILDPELLDPENVFTAEGVAAIVKMLQNAAIGPITMVITVYWIEVVEPQEALKAALLKSGATEPLLADKEAGMLSPRTKAKKLAKPSFVQLYDRFPKFVIGYLVCSCVLSVLDAPGMFSDKQNIDLENLTANASDWWNLVGFVGLGLETDIRVMSKKLRGGGVIALYWIGEVFNVGITLAMAYFAFGYLFCDEFNACAS